MSAAFGSPFDGGGSKSLEPFRFGEVILVVGTDQSFETFGPVFPIQHLIAQSFAHVGLIKDDVG